MPAFGDISVLQATNAFQKSRDRDSLVKLLGAIRQSLQKSSLPADFGKQFDTSVLFPPKVEQDTKEGLE